MRSVLTFARVGRIWILLNNPTQCSTATPPWTWTNESFRFEMPCSKLTMEVGEVIDVINRKAAEHLGSTEDLPVQLSLVGVPLCESGRHRCAKLSAHDVTL